MAGLRFKTRRNHRFGAADRSDERSRLALGIVYLGAVGIAWVAWTVFLGRALYQGLEWLFG